MRISILGGPGSGKSTLAKKIAKELDLPIIHLDALHFAPGWVEIPHPQVLSTIEDKLNGESWIVEGNFSHTWPMRERRATITIELMVPNYIRIARLLRRTLIYRGTTRPDMTEGCPERFDLDFFTFAWKYHSSGRSRRAREHVMAANAAGQSTHIVQNNRDIEKLMRFLKQQN